MTPKSKAKRGEDAEPPARKKPRGSTSTPLKKTVKAKLKNYAAAILEDIEDDDERAHVRQALTSVVKQFLEDYEDLNIPDETQLEEDAPDQEPLKADEDLQALEAELADARNDLEQEEATLKRFRTNRKEVERRERDDERDKLLPLVKALYPEMGRRVSDFQHDQTTSDVPAWLKSLIRDKANKLDEANASDEDEDEVEQAYNPREDEWLQDYIEQLGSTLVKINEATHCLDKLDDLVEIALGAATSQ